jgi:outer membrane protein OmpA-like peptidoglycan-associated protein
MSHRPLILALLLALGAGSAAADGVRLYRAGETVDPREVAAILDPAPVQGRMRSLRLLDEPSPAGAAAVAAAAAGAGAAAAAAALPSSVALPVQFAFDSAEIMPGARAQLDALAEGIRLLPPGVAVRIEGHTDSSGSDAYNDRLSRRRAEAVMSYLVALHRIDPARLRAVGLGEQETLPGRDPGAAENRRVQFRGE